MVAEAASGKSKHQELQAQARAAARARKLASEGKGHRSAKSHGGESPKLESEVKKPKESAAAADDGIRVSAVPEGSS